MNCLILLLQMINETTIEDEDLLSAWVIHFSLARCTTSVLREKLKNRSNIHFWESVKFNESMQFDFIYFLTQVFLTEDIDTLGRIILEPEEVHELVQQMASVRESLNESGEFNEANYRTQIDRQPFIQCNFNDQKCVSFELLVTDPFDPDNNLRGLLRDLQASFNTRNVARGIEVRDNSYVTSHNATKCTRDREDTKAPSSQESTQKRRKGTRNWLPTFAKKNAPTTKSQIKSTENNPSQIAKKKSRKRRISSSGRKTFHGENIKMRRIDTYFKPIPKKIQRKWGDIREKKANGGSTLNKLKIYTIEDDSDSSSELLGNVFHKARLETHDSVVDELSSLEIENQEDCISLSDKTRTSIPTPIQGEVSDTNICETKENLPDCHATQVTQLSAPKAQNVTLTHLTLGTQDNCVETCTETAANMDISDNENNTNLHHYENVFQLDAITRNIIRDWCGGDTFLTQESLRSSGEIMEQDNTDDKDSDNDINEQRNWNNSNDKFDDGDDDDDDDDDDVDDNGVMNEDLYHNRHNGNNDKTDSSSESDDDSDDDDDDDGSDDDIESDDVNDEDYVYDSEDESDSESD